MTIILILILFLTVVVAVFSFGAAAYAPSSVLGSRLRQLGWQKPVEEAKPAFRERIGQALDPLSKALPLSPSEVSRTRAWLIQAGYREASASDDLHRQPGVRSGTGRGNCDCNFRLQFHAASHWRDGVWVFHSANDFEAAHSQPANAHPAGAFLTPSTLPLFAWRPGLLWTRP